MRFLNKIIFINSAHIRYGEVALDGNVHFTGTQGVGKTTLLRAILFFYNADKNKLGLRKQNQCSFDDYYVPTPESYIIYEVARGDSEHPFCVILFRHHNRAAFRFVDAAFDRNWLIDSLGVVASDPVAVRQRIQARGIDFSNIIERYTQYLDIIYGNREARMQKDLLKYYLLRSKKYLNITRIIQNVFLNERVDADFIKDTIINSISGENEELSIDLNFFRTKLVNFTDELRDLSLWTTKNRHGINETRRDADLIIKIAHDISASEFSLRQHCGMLNHARYRAKSDIPVLHSKITKKEEAIGKLVEKLSGLKSKYDLEHEKNLKGIGVLADKLKETATLKKQYANIRIEEMITRVANLPAMHLDLNQKERLLAQSLSEYESISKKYESLTERVNIDKEIYVQKRKQQQNAAISEFYLREESRMEKSDKTATEIQNRFAALIDGIQQDLASNRELLHEQEMMRLEASKSSPLKEDTDHYIEVIRALEKKKISLDHRKLENDNRLEALRNQLENECRKLESDFELQATKLEAKASELKTALIAERNLLKKSKGSLCEWLDSNVASWENTIGKVADEKRVLYSQNLNPRLTDADPNSIFGICIDLDSISKEVRTPAMIEDSVKTLETEINSISTEINRLREDMHLQIEEEEKNARKQMKAIENDSTLILHDIQMCMQKIRTETLRLEDIKMKETERLREIDARYAEKIDELKLKAVDLTENLAETKSKRNQELKKAIKSRDDARRNDRRELDNLLKTIEAEMAEHLKDYTAKINALKREEKAVLSGSGANTELIDSLKNEIRLTKGKIDVVEEEREKVAIYRMDCQRLLDHEPKFQIDKKRLEEKDFLLRQKYDDQREKFELKKAEETTTLDKLKNSLEKTSDALRKTDDFIASAACPAELKEAKSISTEMDCLSILDSIKTLTSEIYRLSDTLKSMVNDFNRKFSSNNTFKFPLAFDSTTGYRNYADSLEEFVNNDKIKDYQQVTSTLYRDILSRAATDFGMLLDKESDIRRIINEINHDFSQKTFAGVIRSIELRLDRSTMPIILQLQNITDFWNANQYELGELNLFSAEGHEDVNREAIKYLKSLTDVLTRSSDVSRLPLEQTFSLKFKIKENDNTTDWTENLKAVGSEGTDILVKAIMNILLVSVFKRRAGQDGDFRVHCMMDEIGRLADENIQGILNFANERDIFIVNSSPKAHKPLSYRHLYMLSKDKDANTAVRPILSTRQAEML